MNIFEPHSIKQQDLILSEVDTTIAITGTQWGKSQGGTLWMQKQICTFTDPRDNFIIGAPTYKILNQSTLPYFLYHMNEFGTYNKKDDAFKIHDAGTVFFRTETDPDSIVGIPNVKAGWLDEAGKLRLYFWENYRARAASKGARTLLSTSPYSMNWIYKDFVKPILSGKLKDDSIKLIMAASWENPHHDLHDPVKRAKIKETMDPKRFDMIFGGQFGKMAGLVYDCFEEDTMQCDPMGLPAGTKYYGGVDWGYTDPFVIKVRAITPSGHHFSISEFYKTRLIIDEQILAARQKQEIFRIDRFWADPSRPDSIEAFNRAGIPTIAADNDIRNGIDAHYALIQSGKYKVFRGSSPHTVDEYSSYHYPDPEDLGPDDDSKEQLPVGQADHCMDVERYLTMMTMGKRASKLTPKAPEERPALSRDHEIRIKQLKKGNKIFPGSETW